MTPKEEDQEISSSLKIFRYFSLCGQKWLWRYLKPGLNLLC